MPAAFRRSPIFLPVICTGVPVAVVTQSSNPASTFAITDPFVTLLLIVTTLAVWVWPEITLR
jgi:hypothetical protein